MGRLRIKKKDVVIPFRETLAYRMILLTASIIAFLVSLFVLIGSLQTGVTPTLIGSAIFTAGLAFLVFYNLDHLRTAKIPKKALNRMNRR